MEVAYNHEARACSCLTRLSRSLSTQQLHTLLQASIKQLITFKELPKFTEETVTKQEAKDYPEDEANKLIQTITPDVKSLHIRKEKANSPTWLLAAKFTFKIINKFGSGATQRKMQEIYKVKAKQLATCITGYKYLGGAEKRAQNERHQMKVINLQPASKTITTQAGVG